MRGVGVWRLIPNPIAVLVYPSQRLLKQAGRRVTLRDRPFDDIELVFVHGDSSECAGLIGVVSELEKMPFHKILPFVGKARYLHVPLKQFERCIDDRSTLILLPVSRANHSRGIFTTLFIAGRTCLRALDTLL